MAHIKNKAKTEVQSTRQKGGGSGQSQEAWNSQWK